MKYFAYGSNMDQTQMGKRCPAAENLSVGKLSGYQFALDLEGAATIIKNTNTEVWGILWEISVHEKNTLDLREGVARGCYSVTNLLINKGEEHIEALVYVSCRGSNQGKRRPGYLEKIIQAATYYHLPNWYIAYLKSI